MARLHALLGSLLGLAIALPAAASTMPRADMAGHDDRYFGVGIGNGLSVSLDAPLNRQLTLGGSIGTGVLWDNTLARYDVRAVYDFVNGGRRNLSIAGILGVWGTNPPFINPYGTQGWPVLEVGFGLAYPFTRRLTGRLNLIVPYYGSIAGPYYYFFSGPAGGAELAYAFTPAVEGTIGVNGQGNLLGLKMNF